VSRRFPWGQRDRFIKNGTAPFKAVTLCILYENWVGSHYRLCLCALSVPSYWRVQHTYKNIIMFIISSMRVRGLSIFWKPYTIIHKFCNLRVVFIPFNPSWPLHACKMLHAYIIQKQLLLPAIIVNCCFYGIAVDLNTTFIIIHANKLYSIMYDYIY